MLKATLGDAGAPLSILCLGAHCDDIAIGCGGTLLRVIAERPGTSVDWVVFASDTRREAEERTSAAQLLAQALSTLEAHSFRDSFFPSLEAPIKERFEALKGRVAPDLVLTHNTKDAHQDHRTIAELTWNTFRDHLIVEYEIPKYDGDLGRPSLFVPLTEELARRKIDVVIGSFRSQASRRWFQPETFEALMRLRGMECNARDGFAEAFYVRKLSL